MINTDEFGVVTIGGKIDRLFSEYASAGIEIARCAIAEGYDERALRAVFEACFSLVTEVFEKEKK